MTGPCAKYKAVKFTPSAPAQDEYKRELLPPLPHAAIVNIQSRHDSSLPKLPTTVGEGCTINIIFLQSLKTSVIGYYVYHLMTLLFACFISFQHEKRVLGCETCFVYENARFPFVVSPVSPPSHRQFTQKWPYCLMTIITL